LPAKNSDSLLGILEQAGVETEIVDKLTVNGVLYPRGTAVVRMNQPYANFAKALLEKQSYPNLRDREGRPIPPYDVTAHTLSLLMGVEARPVFAPFKYSKLRPEPSGRNGGCGEGVPARRALYRSHVPSMDEGWTRWVLDQAACWNYSSLEDAEARRGNLRAKFDAIIIPDHSPRALMEGHRKGTMPEELTGGLGLEGVRALREFVEAGGTLIFLNRASDFAINQLKLPVRDVTEGLKETEFYVPGSILRTELDTTHPVAKGMPRESIAWAEDSPVFELSDAKEAARVRVIARYPATADPLLSGCRKPSSGQAARSMAKRRSSSCRSMRESSGWRLSSS
jgi:hypothetical protein